MRSRMSDLHRYSLTLVLICTALGLTPARPAAAGEQNALTFERFDLLSETSGWVLGGRQLFWTSDLGRSWTTIGPAIPPSASVQDVEFIDARVGWMLWSTTASNGSSSFQLAYTTDRGAEWTVQSLSLFEPGEVAAFAEKAEMGWFDVQRGWISVKQATGSNFSVGTLFVTSDGGSTWARAPLPVADRIDFSDPLLGWAVGGPTQGQIFQSQDAGRTWQAVSLENVPEDTLVIAYMPYSSDGEGLLVTTHLGSENSLNAYVLDPASSTWLNTDRISLHTDPGVIGLSILDTRNFVAAIPGTSSMVRMVDGELTILENQDGFSDSIVEVDMFSLETGWGKSVDAGCVASSARDGQTGSVSCTSGARLLLTTDGGATWQNLDLPAPQSGASVADTFHTTYSPEMNSASGAENAQVLIGQGFDKCEIPTLSQLQAWAGNSPYQAVNLYIGGTNRTCSNTSLTAAFLRQAYQQGWKFIPTWVGPQAPCSGYASRLSNDPGTAFSQGLAEANLAVERLAALGLTLPDKSGSVVYYDIENYGTNSSCRNAVNAFINGWVSQLQASGNLAGVYGSTLCNTGLSDFMNITNVPDAIWAARWYHSMDSGYHDPEASVWNLGSCVPNAAWPNHQRIRQYEGDHNESWGNLPLRIDSNVLDGPVALPFGFFVSRITRSGTNPTTAASVQFIVSFLEPVSGVNIADFSLFRTGVTGAQITSVSGSGSTYTVTVDTGVGSGIIRLDLIDDDSIRNASNQPLAGLGTGNGNYTQGQPYTIIKTSTFEDVTASHWAWQYIERLYEAGITGGCNVSPPSYCPDATVTRAQMAVFLERGIHGPSYAPPAVGNETGFADVPSDHWAADWIKQLAVDGITGGCGGGNYCPEAPVTRAQMAVFLLRSRYAVSYSPPNAGSGTGFGDVPSGYWAADWIKQLVMEGITAGCGGGNYCPEQAVTRAQMAVFLVKTFRLP
jgi:photosystem II stability/assembly factor-like uncharacterized protein